MHKPTKPLLLAALSLTALLLAVLLLPLHMDRVMAGTLNTVHSFTDNPQLSAETIAPSQTAEPTLSLLPIRAGTPTAEATGSPVQLPLQTIPPSPALILSLPGNSPSSLQPSDWHQLMQPQPLEALKEMEPAASAWAKLNPGFSLTKEGISIHQLAPGQFLLEELVPLSLASRKLLKGIAENLLSESIYVPDQATLDRLRPLVLDSVILSNQGAAGLLATYDSTLPLAAFTRHAAASASALLTPGEYLSLRQDMMQEAHNKVYSNPDQSAAQSRALVEQLMQGEQPLKLSVLRIEPYAPEGHWTYYMAGHHLHCINMDDGSSLTITTDLISDRMVGFATEGAEPFLKVYARTLRKAEQIRNQADEGLREQVQAHANQLLDQLSGVNTSQQPERWNLVLSYVYAPEWQKGYWAMEAQPNDALAGALDPGGRPVPIYTLELDGDLSLRSWFMAYLGEHQVRTDYLPEQGAQDWFAQQSAQYASSHSTLIDTLSQLMADPDQFGLQAAADLGQKWKTLIPQRVDSIGIHTLLPLKGNPEPSLVFTLHALGEDGIRYSIDCTLRPHHEFTYRTIHRQYELPPGAVELKG